MKQGFSNKLITPSTPASSAQLHSPQHLPDRIPPPHPTTPPPPTGHSPTLPPYPSFYPYSHLPLWDPEARETRWWHADHFIVCSERQAGVCLWTCASKQGGIVWPQKHFSAGGEGKLVTGCGCPLPPSQLPPPLPGAYECSSGGRGWTGGGGGGGGQGQCREGTVRGPYRRGSLVKALGTFVHLCVCVGNRTNATGLVF